MPANRREFLAALAAAPAALAQPRDSRPNFLIVMADDMGFSDIGCYGGEIATPNIDRLASQGVRFTQFYNCARCCPTRASLLTGLYNHQAGVGHMINDLGRPAYQGYLNERCATFAQVLKPAGYTTLMSGKWHVGENRPHWPLDRGFDQYFGLISGASNYYRLDSGRKMALGNQPYTPPGTGFYMTDAFTRHAERMVGEAPQDRPLALYLAYTAPHWPLHALPEDLDKYRGRYMKGWDVLRAERHERMKAFGLVDHKWPLSPRDSTVPAWSEIPAAGRRLWDLRMAVYAAMIDRMDQGIGRVLESLRRANRLENTVVLFLADNGGCHEENIGGGLEKKASNPEPGGVDSFTSYRRNWANASNTPFRYYKSFVHEGGIASPLVAWRAGGLKRPGRLYRKPAHVTDIAATLYDLAKAPYPAGRIPLEGRSLAPVFRGREPDPRQSFAWEHQGHGAVRDGDWKLVARHGQPWELYHLRDDRTELNDLGEKDPQRVRRMRRMYANWSTRCGVLPWEQVSRKRA